MANRRVRNANPRDASNFQLLGFRDYEASRQLLLSNLLLPGATLASTALEKYLKCILAIGGVRINLHLDDIGKFRRPFEAHGVRIFEELDPVFLETLSSAYRLRYYDTVEKAVFGFFKWQLLGELDATMALINKRLTLKRSDGIAVMSAYQQALQVNSKTICDENFLVAGISKKEFMERKGPAIMMRVDNSYGEILVEAKELAAKSYEGRITSLVGVKIDGR